MGWGWTVVTILAILLAVNALLVLYLSKRGRIWRFEPRTKGSPKVSLESYRGKILSHDPNSVTMEIGGKTQVILAANVQESETILRIAEESGREIILHATILNPCIFPERKIALIDMNPR